jgi:hypothetical protein
MRKKPKSLAWALDPKVTIADDDFRAQAIRQQELDYLHQYLHTRGEEHSKQLQRLRALAKQWGVEWKLDPPKPMNYYQRLATLTGKPRGKKGKAA